MKRLANLTFITVLILGICGLLAAESPPSQTVQYVTHAELAEALKKLEADLREDYNKQIDDLTAEIGKHLSRIEELELARDDLATKHGEEYRLRIFANMNSGNPINRDFRNDIAYSTQGWLKVFNWTGRKTTFCVNRTPWPIEPGPNWIPAPFGTVVTHHPNGKMRFYRPEHWKTQDGHHEIKINVR